MKTFIIAFFVILFFSIDISLFAQCDAQREVIRNNTRKSFITNNGMIANNDPADANALFENGDTPIFTLGYAKSLWLSGTDPSGNLKLSANTYPSNSEDDFISGPLDRATGLPLDEGCTFFNRIWKVSAFQINQTIAKWDDGSITTDNIPQDILEWPAFGNPYIPFDIVFTMAPFFDQDGDGLYDPIQGDYPIPISENTNFVPFEFSFCVYNDVTNHSSTNGDPLQMEIQQINYLLNCQDRPAGQTVFTRLRTVYLGQETLNNVRIGVWEDSDLGCFNNDYQGCNRDLNCVYFYNKDGESSIQSQCFGNVAVPDSNGVVRTTVFFNKTMESHIYFTNGISGGSSPLIIGPSSPGEYYSFLNAKWRDGTSLTVGGNGLDFGSTNETQFAFPDLPTDPNGWSMQAVDLPLVFDYRAVTRLNSADQFPGTVTVYDIGDYVLYDENIKKLEIFDQWPDRINELKEDYTGILNGDFNCGLEIIPCVENCVWPGDVNRDGIVNGIDVVYDGVLISQAPSNGIPRQIISSEWFPFDSENWGEDIQNLDVKNGDINGNGVINRNDINQLVKNFNKTNNELTFTRQRETTLDLLGLSINYNRMEISATEPTATRSFSVKVQLGNDASEISEPIHGISYIMQFDTNLVRPYKKIDTPPLQEFDFKQAYLHKEGLNFFEEVTGDNAIQYAFSNLTNGNRQFGGRISEQLMQVKENAVTSNPDGRDTLIIGLYNIFAMNDDGDIIDVGIQYDSLIITDLPFDPDVISSSKHILSDIPLTIYPNPVDDFINLSFGSVQEGKISVMDNVGKLVLSANVKNEVQKTISLSALESGIYFLNFENAAGASVVKKIIKL